MTILKKILEKKFVYVTNDTTKTNIKNHICHCTTLHLREMVICDSDSMTGGLISHQ
jgi:hypothetical protein